MTNDWEGRSREQCYELGYHRGMVSNLTWGQAMENILMSVVSQAMQAPEMVNLPEPLKSKIYKAIQEVPLSHYEAPIYQFPSGDSPA